MFATTWSCGKRLGARKYDDFHGGTAFEGCSHDWSNLTQDELSRKLDQLGCDLDLLANPDSEVTRVIWFGCNPLPTDGLGGQLREAIDAARSAGYRIEYWHTP